MTNKRYDRSLAQFIMMIPKNPVEHIVLIKGIQGKSDRQSCVPNNPDGDQGCIASYRVVTQYQCKLVIITAITFLLSRCLTGPLDIA